MVTFTNRFIQSFSTLTKLLWGQEQQKSFDSLIHHLCRNPIVAFFNINRKTEAIIDTSPVGLGGILVQCDDDGIGKFVAYAS